MKESAQELALVRPIPVCLLFGSGFWLLADG
jgi:hypothetical protein